MNHVEVKQSRAFQQKIMHVEVNTFYSRQLANTNANVITASLGVINMKSDWVNEQLILKNL